MVLFAIYCTDDVPWIPYPNTNIDLTRGTVDLDLRCDDELPEIFVKNDDDLPEIFVRNISFPEENRSISMECFLRLVEMFQLHSDCSIFLSQTFMLELNTVVEFSEFPLNEPKEMSPQLSATSLKLSMLSNLLYFRHAIPKISTTLGQCRPFLSWAVLVVILAAAPVNGGPVFLVQEHHVIIYCGFSGDRGLWTNGILHCSVRVGDGWNTTRKFDLSIPSPCPDDKSSFSKYSGFALELILWDGIISKRVRSKYSHSEGNFTIHNLAVEDLGQYEWLCGDAFNKTTVLVSLEANEDYLTPSEADYVYNDNGLSSYMTTPNQNQNTITSTVNVDMTLIVAVVLVIVVLIIIIVGALLLSKRKKFCKKESSESVYQKYAASTEVSHYETVRVPEQNTSLI